MARLISIPGGDVQLSDARRGTTRQVSLQPFLISRTAVTEPEFSAGRLADQGAGAVGLPAHGISWASAVAWCNAASAASGLTLSYRIDGDSVQWDPAADGYRLPTEAEWVHAALGGTLGPRYGELAEIGWSAGDHVTGPQPVGLKSPNGYGVFDALGNVWEWCWDRLDPARYGAYRLLKGGGWADPEWSCRVGARRGNATNAVLEDVGFRVARGAVAGRAETTDGGQGWSEAADRERASLAHPLPVGWTPLRFDT